MDPNRSALRWGRRTVAIVPVTVAALAAVLASSVPASARSTAPHAPVGVDTVNVSTPAVPTNLRISAYAYAGFQRCRATVPVISGTYDSAATFAATPGRFDSKSSRVGRFEVARPDGETLTTVGNLYGVDFPPGSFTPGMHRFRVQAQEGNVVSAWSPWCDFLVE